MYQAVFDLQAEFLKALAHPRRLEIVQLLRDQELCVSDIYEMLDLPQANTSQHLTILRDAGVVTATKDGKQVLYQITHPKVLDACDLIREVLVDQNTGTELADQLTFSMKDLLPITHDPVCHMRVSPKTAGSHANHKGQNYYFCASGCLKKFNQSPEQYV